MQKYGLFKDMYAVNNVYLYKKKIDLNVFFFKLHKLKTFYKLLIQFNSNAFKGVECNLKIIFIHFGTGL